MTTTQIAPAARQRLLPPETGRAGFADALRSEFTKIRSTRSTYWTLFALIVVCIGIGALASAGTASHPNGISRASFDSTQQSLAGLYVGQLVIAVLGALTITSEYTTGMIRTSLAVQPRRGVVFAAKGVVFAVVTTLSIAWATWVEPIEAPATPTIPAAAAPAASSDILECLRTRLAVPLYREDVDMRELIRGNKS